MIDDATPKSMSATQAGSTSGGNLCHLLVRRACNVAMSKSVAPAAVMFWFSAVARTFTGRRPSEDLASDDGAIDSRLNAWRIRAPDVVAPLRPGRWHSSCPTAELPPLGTTPV